MPFFKLNKKIFSNQQTNTCHVVIIIVEVMLSTLTFKKYIVCLIKFVIEVSQSVHAPGVMIHLFIYFFYRGGGEYQISVGIKIKKNYELSLHKRGLIQGY